MDDFVNLQVYCNISWKNRFLRGVLPWTRCLFSDLDEVESWTEMFANNIDVFKPLAVARTFHLTSLNTWRFCLELLESSQLLVTVATTLNCLYFWQWSDGYLNTEITLHPSHPCQAICQSATLDYMSLKIFLRRIVYISRGFFWAATAEGFIVFIQLISIFSSILIRLLCALSAEFVYYVDLDDDLITIYAEQQYILKGSHTFIWHYSSIKENKGIIAQKSKHLFVIITFWKHPRTHSPSY